MKEAKNDQQLDQYSDSETQHLERMGLKSPSSNGLPSKSNGDDKVNVVNFEFDNRPSKLSESGQTTQGTSESTSSAEEPLDLHHHLQQQQQMQDNNSESRTNGIGPLHQQYGDTRQQLHQHLSNELTSLHTSTHQAIQLSYMEQEHLSNDITKMQSRISYLKRKIGLARLELIAKCGAHMNDELLRLSLVKEVDSVDIMSDDEDNEGGGGGGGGNNKTKDFEVTFESFKSNENNLISNNNNNKMESQNSGLSSGPSSHDDSDVVSGTSSLFRITFGGVDGMPSRWRNREMEREKSELAKKSSNGGSNLVKDECLSINSIAGDDADDGADGNKDAAVTTENTKEQQLITLKQLVNDRESEISFLEKEMMTVEKEKSSLENDISMMTSNMERSKIEAEKEKEKLVGVIDFCKLDNRRLEKALLETTVSLGVNKMNIELLGNDLRDARKKFIEFQKRKERKKYERKMEQRIDIPHFSESSASNQPSRVARYEVPINMGSYRDAGERKPGYARNTTSLSNSGLSMESTLTMMSALTSDFSDVVDVLEGTGSTS